MKEMLTRNIGLKIIAVILAAILWLVINNMEDPMTVVSFHNVPVKQLNKQAIESLNQFYQPIEGEKINFTFAARRSIADSLNENNFVVTADLSKVTDLGTVTINISCPGYEDEVIIKNSSHQVMTIAREEKEKIREVVKVKLKGEPAEGYYVAKKTSNTMVTVTGPKSKIDKIKEIIAEVDVTEEAQTGILRYFENIKVVDEEGKEIDKSNLIFTQEIVPISIEIYPTKIIDIVVATQGVPAEGYFMTNMEYGPKKIEIAGKEEIIKSITSLTVTESIEGATANIKNNIDLNDFLDDGLIIVNDDDSAFIDITIEKAVTKKVTILTGDIVVKNKPALSISYQNPGPITLELSGPGSELTNISVKSIKPYIDLFRYTYGNYEVKLDIEKIENASNVSLINQPIISVYLSP